MTTMTPTTLINKTRHSTTRNYDCCKCCHFEKFHDPQKFFGIKQMMLPDYTMGRDYALLNQLRSQVRETEVAAVDAFRVGDRYTRGDIVEELNRLSSAMHIMMCMYLAGQYR